MLVKPEHEAYILEGAKPKALNPKPHSANPHQHAPGLGPSDRRLGRYSAGLSKQGWVYSVWHTGLG